MTVRAVFLAALLAGPLTAAAQAAGVAELVDEEAEINYLGLAQCRGEGDLDELRWTLDTGSQPFTTGGEYIFFVSSDGEAASGDDAGFCPKTNATEGTRKVELFRIDAENGPSVTREFDSAQIPSAFGLTCDAQPEQSSLYLCIEWWVGANRLGSAVANLRLEFQPPAAPANVRITPSEEALDVDWDEGTRAAGQVESFEYQAVATAGDVVRRSRRVTATEARIEGLDNDITYTIEVFAFSRGNNQSAPSTAVTGMPIPIDDFWEHYQKSGGPDSGGCSSGAAGLGAIAGLALALAIRSRRRS